MVEDTIQVAGKVEQVQGQTGSKKMDKNNGKWSCEKVSRPRPTTTAERNNIMARPSD